jgi:hypothetical protein
MKFHHLSFSDAGELFSLSPYFGCLYKSASFCMGECGDQTLPKKLKQILENCRNPFTLTPNIIPVHNSYPTAGRKAAERSLKRILRLCKTNFWLARCYASLLRPKFQSAREAVNFFNEITSHLDHDTLCLPRSLFAAAHSHAFRQSGAVLIGIFLPSRSMHAWIIEDGCQPDPQDSMWINYRPVAALC